MMDIKELLPLLRANGVRSYKSDGGHIELELFPTEPAPIQAPELPPGAPPELKDPDLMSQDAILNWSAPPGPGEDGQEPVVMTGDEP